MGMKQILVMMAAVVVGCSDDTPETSQAAEAETQVAPEPSPEPDPVPPVDEKLIVEWAVRQKLNKPEGELIEADWENLSYLDFRNTQITDASLKDVAKLKKLEMLGLDNTQITDAGLKEVAKLQKLEVLYLNNTQITKTGVAELRKAVPNCEIEGP